MGTISVILPVYNEEKCIASTLESVVKFARNHPYYQFVFVDDGSSDKTKEILESKINLLHNINVSLISYKNHHGKGYAVKTGVLYAKSDYICFLDGDLAYSLDHLELVIDRLAEFDIVIGCRTLTTESGNGFSFTRKLAGKIFNIISRRILNLKFSDMQAGIKGFKNYAAKDLFKAQKMPGFAFDVELIYLAKKKGYDIAEIPAVVSQKHLYKDSKVKLFKHSIEMLLNLLQIRYNDTVGKYE